MPGPRRRYFSLGALSYNGLRDWPGLASPSQPVSSHAGGIHPNPTGRLGRRVCACMKLCVRADWLGPVFARKVTRPWEGWQPASGIPS